MVLSYAKHFGLSHDEAAYAICTSTNANAADEKTVWQFLGSWSDHVKTWTEAKGFPVCVLRYEDMLKKPEETFSEALNAMGITPGPERLARAIEFSSFKEVRKQEEKKECAERSPHSEKFFNKGQSGYWKDDLSDELVQKIRQNNKKMMKRYGYYSV